MRCFNEGPGFAACVFALACTSGDPGGAEGSTGAAGTTTQPGTSGATTATTGASATSSTPATTDATPGSTGSAESDASSGTGDTGYIEPPKGWAPCGGPNEFLWAWGWAGENGENLELDDPDSSHPRILRMEDLSGHEHHFYDDFGAAFEVGLTWNDYTTELPVIGVHSYADGFNNYDNSMLQEGSMAADGGFYLAFAGMNTRDDGNREVWGSEGENFVRIHQDPSYHIVNATIGGQNVDLTPREALPGKGPLLLEVFRDDAGSISVFANGQDVSAGVVETAVFDVSGVGYKGSGTSNWDDGAFEHVMCKGLPDETMREEAREYLRNKWELF